MKKKVCAHKICTRTSPKSTIRWTNLTKHTLKEKYFCKKKCFTNFLQGKIRKYKFHRKKIYISTYLPHFLRHLNLFFRQNIENMAQGKEQHWAKLQKQGAK